MSDVKNSFICMGETVWQVHVMISCMSIEYAFGHSWPNKITYFEFERIVCK